MDTKVIQVAFTFYCRSLELCLFFEYRNFKCPDKSNSYSILSNNFIFAESSISCPTKFKF